MKLRKNVVMIAVGAMMACFGLSACGQEDTVNSVPVTSASAEYERIDGVGSVAEAEMDSGDMVVKLGDADLWITIPKTWYVESEVDSEHHQIQYYENTDASVKVGVYQWNADYDLETFLRYAVGSYTDYDPQDDEITSINGIECAYFKTTMPSYSSASVNGNNEKVYTFAVSGGYVQIVLDYTSKAEEQADGIIATLRQNVTE